MIERLRHLLWWLGAPAPWGLDPDRISAETIRAAERYEMTRGVEQVASRWPWNVNGRTEA